MTLSLEAFAPYVLRLMPDAELVAPEPGDERPGAHPRAHLCKAGVQAVAFHLPTDTDPALAARELVARFERSACDAIRYLGPTHEGNALVASSELDGVARAPWVDESIALLGRTDVRASRLGVSRAKRDESAQRSVLSFLDCKPASLAACSGLLIDVAASYLDDDTPLEHVAESMRAVRDVYGAEAPERVGRAALRSIKAGDRRAHVAAMLLLWRERLLSAG